MTRPAAEPARTEPAEMADMPVMVAGERIVLDPAGALWIASCRTLVVADLHLEKGSSFARRRIFLPPYDTEATLQALGLLIARRDPARVICLGDSFHDGNASERLTPAALGLIHRMQHGREWIWITGNHDPRAPANLGGDSAPDVTIGGLLFRHEPGRDPRDGEVAGHLHPSAKIRQRGRSVRRPAFVTDGRRLIMPAFGAFTGGLNVLDQAFSTLFDRNRQRTFMLGRGRLYAIAPASLRAD